MTTVSTLDCKWLSDKARSREDNQEAIAIIQARDNNSLIRGSSDGGNEKWLDSGCILKVEL